MAGGEETTSGHEALPLYGCVAFARIFSKARPGPIRLRIPFRDSCHFVSIRGSSSGRWGFDFRTSIFPRCVSRKAVARCSALSLFGLGGWEFAQMLRAILTGGYEPAEDIDYLQLREFTVTAEPEAPVELDGELSAHTTPITFRPAPFKL
jgi:Sphingosine kinase and enzymes related to eukaryotic diacylglycerol kinase